MELWADRFVLDPVDAGRRTDRERRGTSPLGAGAAIGSWMGRDLSSGATVTIIESSAGEAGEQLRWALRCQRFAAWHQPQLARLLDYGPIGTGRRFEAWRASRPRVVGCAAVHASVRAFLEANELRPCTAGAPVLSWAGRPVIVPDLDAGREAARADGAPCGPPLLAACAIESIERPAVAAVAELLADPERREPVAIALWGEPGAGRGAAARTLARIARLHGCVPIDATVVDRRCWELVADRTMLLIDRGRDRYGWRQLLAAFARGPRPHVLLVLADAPITGVHSLQLAPIAAADLADAVRPHAWAAASRAVVCRAAEKARGNPWRFANALWTGTGRSGRTVLAAERAPRYRVTVSLASAAVEPRSSPAPACPIAEDVTRLRRRLEAAIGALAARPGAAALRETRASLQGLVRRREWRGATTGAIALVAALTRRGEFEDARRVIHDARGWLESVHDQAAHVELTLAVASLQLEQGLTGDAEATARAALAAAAATGDDRQRATASAILSRALFWQARYEEASAVVSAAAGEIADDRLAALLGIAAAFAATGSREMQAAAAAAARAVAAAERSDDPAWRARAAAAASFVQLALDDRAAALSAAERALAAAHAAGDPTLALDARLFAAEAHRREGRLAPATRLLRRVHRWPARRQGAALAARIVLLRDAVAGGPVHAAAARIAARTGLQALPLFAPQPLCAAPGVVPADEVLELVGRIQAAQDDRSALVAICSAVRDRLRAAGVGFVVRTPGAPARLVVSDGARLEPGLGERVLAADRPIDERPAAAGWESGVPVRYGGQTCGVLVARWRAGLPPVSPRATAVLSVAAAVAAPALAALLREPISSPPDAIVGISDGIAAVRRAVDRAADAPYPVLIEGESGSGKELVARALHRRSQRRDRPFVAINCAALPDDLLEAELFGHAKGAFTGAMVERGGVFEAAHGGTLFLDEVGELSLRAQAKLLRTLQDGEVRRVGENLARRVDVRVVAATNRRLREEVAGGRFRLDLLYRLDVVRIVVPPLRDRLVDLPLLIERYWREAIDRVHSRAVLAVATIAALSRYPWPGNVRELQNVLASLAVRAPRRGVVPPEALPWTPADDGQVRRLDAARRDFETRFIQAALARAGGHRGRAASELGVSRQGLTKLLTRLAIADAEPESADDGQGAGGARYDGSRP